jgi:hypothetical protein
MALNVTQPEWVVFRRLFLFNLDRQGQLRTICMFLCQNHSLPGVDSGLLSFSDVSEQQHLALNCLAIYLRKGSHNNCQYLTDPIAGPICVEQGSLWGRTLIGHACFTHNHGPTQDYLL